MVALNQGILKFLLFLIPLFPLLTTGGAAWLLCDLYYPFSTLLPSSWFPWAGATTAHRRLRTVCGDAAEAIFLSRRYHTSIPQIGDLIWSGPATGRRCIISWQQRHPKLVCAREISCQAALVRALRKITNCSSAHPVVPLQVKRSTICACGSSSGTFFLVMPKF